MSHLEKNRRVLALVAALVVAAVAAAAALASTSARVGARATAPDHLTIAYQPGIGYAPLILLKQQRTLERQFPGLSIDWKVLSSGSPITDGVISGKIDIGAMGTGPFLVGWARGVNWKAIAPLDEADLWLMAKDPKIKTIADLKGKRIATPTNTSIQAVMLRKMAQVKLGDAHALDTGLIAMDHPDGLQALLSGQIDAHFTSPPFQFVEKAQGAHVVGRSFNYFGAHSFLVTVLQQKFYDQYPQFANTFYKDVKKAQDLLNKKPATAAKILAVEDPSSATAAQYKAWITDKAIHYTTRPRGLMRTANFMNKIGLLSKMPGSWKDLVFPPVYPTKGS